MLLKGEGLIGIDLTVIEHQGSWMVMDLTNLGHGIVTMDYKLALRCKGCEH
jgi:hypothetical protein